MTTKTKLLGGLLSAATITGVAVGVVIAVTGGSSSGESLDSKLGVTSDVDEERDPSDWRFHATFESKDDLPLPVGECFARGEAWADPDHVRIVYSGTGTPSCWQATGGATVELVADGEGFWLYNRETGEEDSFTTDTMPIVNKDFSSLLSNQPPWCDSQYYRCQVAGEETVAGKLATVVVNSPLVPAPPDPLVQGVLAGDTRYWVDPETGRALKQLAFDSEGNLISQYVVKSLDTTSPLPEAIFDRKPFPGD